ISAKIIHDNVFESTVCQTIEAEVEIAADAEAGLRDIEISPAGGESFILPRQVNVIRVVFVEQSDEGGRVESVGLPLREAIPTITVTEPDPESTYAVIRYVNRETPTVRVRGFIEDPVAAISRCIPQCEISGSPVALNAAGLGKFSFDASVPVTLGENAISISTTNALGGAGNRIVRINIRGDNVLLPGPVNLKDFPSKPSEAVFDQYRVRVKFNGPLSEDVHDRIDVALVNALSPDLPAVYTTLTEKGRSSLWFSDNSGKLVVSLSDKPLFDPVLHDTAGADVVVQNSSGEAVYLKASLIETEEHSLEFLSSGLFARIEFDTTPSPNIPDSARLLVHTITAGTDEVAVLESGDNTWMFSGGGYEVEILPVATVPLGAVSSDGARIARVRNHSWIEPEMMAIVNWADAKGLRIESEPTVYKQPELGPAGNIYGEIVGITEKGEAPAPFKGTLRIEDVVSSPGLYSGLALTVTGTDGFGTTIDLGMRRVEEGAYESRPFHATAVGPAAAVYPPSEFDGFRDEILPAVVCCYGSRSHVRVGPADPAAAGKPSFEIPITPVGDPPGAERKVQPAPPKGDPSLSAWDVGTLDKAKALLERRRGMLLAGLFFSMLKWDAEVNKDWEFPWRSDAPDWAEIAEKVCEKYGLTLDAEGPDAWLDKLSEVKIEPFARYKRMDVLHGSLYGIPGQAGILDAAGLMNILGSNPAPDKIGMILEREGFLHFEDAKWAMKHAVRAQIANYENMWLYWVDSGRLWLKELGGEVIKKTGTPEQLRAISLTYWTLFVCGSMWGEIVAEMGLVRGSAQIMLEEATFGLATRRVGPATVARRMGWENLGVTTARQALMVSRRQAGGKIVRMALNESDAARLYARLDAPQEATVDELADLIENAIMRADRPIRERFAKHLEVLRGMRKDIKCFTSENLGNLGFSPEERIEIIEAARSGRLLGYVLPIPTKDGMRYVLFVNTLPQKIAKEERASFLFHEIDHIVTRQRDPRLAHPAEPPWLYPYSPLASEYLTYHAQNDFRMLFATLRSKRWNDEDIRKMAEMSLRIP
ncbi:MAG: hypothetical protein N3A38_11060, partial [Planctomycetota bacterium]|nr:hypothetical protein [Planctomycetota bacterium]